MSTHFRLIRHPQPDALVADGFNFSTVGLAHYLSQQPVGWRFSDDYFLAMSPYWDDNGEVLQQGVEEVTFALADLLCMGYIAMEYDR